MKKTENDNFPLTIPRTNSGTLCSARHYSSLDLGLGYLQEESTRRMFKNVIQHKNREICIFKNGSGIERALSSFSKVHERDFYRSHAPRRFGLYR